MGDNYQSDYRDEEEEDKFKTPQVLEKNKKRKKKIAENHDEEDKAMNIRVKQISEKSDRAPPIVAYFSSGYNPSAGNPNSDVRESPRVTVYRHKTESKKRAEVVVSPPGTNVEFVGTNYTGEQAARQTCVYTLGVLDKEAQTLTILPIAHNKVFRLEPRVKTKESVDSEASASAAVTEIDDGERLARSRAELRNRYETKKAINRDKKKFALKIEDGPEAQKFLDGKLNDVDVKTDALESTNSFVARNIPPYDASATTPSEAYPIEKIIEKGEWHYLQDIYQLLQQETEASTDSYPLFVRNRLDKLRDNKDETEKETVSGVLSLLTHLVKFKDLYSVDFASVKDYRFPRIIRQKCNNMFKDQDEPKRLSYDRINLLISYVLVLALHVDNFKTNPEDIAKDLRMSTVDLRKHFENLGCKFSREKSILLATLPVPLKFPEIRRKRRR